VEKVRVPYSRLGHAPREVQPQATGKSDWDEAKALVAFGKPLIHGTAKLSPQPAPPGFYHQFPPHYDC
jgi:hypothetical protein